MLERLLPPPPARFAFTGGESGAWSRRAPPTAHAERYCLHVRSVAADGVTHRFQFAMVDADADVALSVFASAPSPVGEPAPDGAPAETPIQALDWAGLDAAMRPFKGAQVVAFGRLIQGSFLPPRACAEIAGLDCARAHFLKLARRRGLRADPGAVLDFNDARVIVGLPPVRSPDAALRALGLRELCLWMDENR